MLRTVTVIVDVCLAAAGEKVEVGGGGDTLPLSASHVGPSLAEWWEGGGCECGAGVTRDRGGAVAAGESWKRAAAFVGISDLE